MLDPSNLMSIEPPILPPTMNVPQGRNNNFELNFANGENLPPTIAQPEEKEEEKKDKKKKKKKDKKDKKEKKKEKKRKEKEESKDEETEEAQA